MHHLRSATNYLIGLVIAWVGFIAAFAAWYLAFFGFRRGILGSLLYSASGGLLFGSMFVAVLAVFTGPFLWQAGRRRFTWMMSFVIGAAAAPIHVMLMWLIMRERSETFGALLSAWRRFPSGEWGLLLWPTFIGATLFISWAASRRSLRRAMV